MRGILLISILVVLAGLPRIVAAQPVVARERSRIELPLGGYYRPGRSMPVVVHSREPGARILIQCDGMIPVNIPPGFNGVFPLFILNAPPDVELIVSENGDEIARFALHALSADQKLVAQFDGARPPVGMFGDRSIITVRPTSDLRWMKLNPLQSLDAIVVRDAASIDLPGVLAAGAAVGVASDRRPDDQLPWQQIGDGWMLAANLGGPGSIVGGENVYLPTQAWEPSLSSPVRWRVVMAGVLVSFGFLGCLVLPGRFAPIFAAFAIAGIACVAIFAWRRTLPEVSSVSGNIVVANHRIIQTDHWEYVAASHAGMKRATRPEQPIAYDASHLAGLDLRMIVQADGSVLWEYSLGSNARLAFLRRRVDFGTVPTVPSDAIHSPLEELAKQGYLRSGFQIKGQLRSPRQEWGTTVLVRENAE